MPIIALCTHCGQGKVRAGRRFEGTRVECPACHNSFVVARQDDATAARLKEVRRRRRNGGTSSGTATLEAAPRSGESETLVVRCTRCGRGKIEVARRYLGRRSTCRNCGKRFRIAYQDEAMIARLRRKRSKRADFVALPMPEMEPAPEPVVSPPMPVVIPVTPPPPGGIRLQSPSPLALSAFILVGLGMAATQLPYGRAFGFPLGFLGLLLGTVAWMFDEEAWLPRLATGFNALFLGTAMLAPTWFGLRPLADPRPEVNPNRIQSVNSRTHESTGGDWTDAAASYWLQNDVKVAVGKITVETPTVADPAGGTPKRRRILVIPISVENGGVARTVEFTGWKPGVVRLTDSAGRELKTLPPEANGNIAPSSAAGAFAAVQSGEAEVRLRNARPGRRIPAV